MEKLTYQTPDGSETLYETVLSARIELLQARLRPLIEQYIALPATAELLSRMLPAVRSEWACKTAKDRPAFLEITPTHLTGFGFSVPYREMIGMEAVTKPMELWAFALALAEGLRSGLPDPEGMRICPLYLENGLNLAVGSARMAVEIRCGGM